MFLPGESHGQRSLVDYSPWGHKESDTTEGLHHHLHSHISEMIIKLFIKVIKSVMRIMKDKMKS